MKQMGIKRNEIFKSKWSPAIPIIQGMRPKPATPTIARRTKRIVESVSKSSAAMARIVGQKHAVAIPAKKSYVMNMIRLVTNGT